MKMKEKSLSHVKGKQGSSLLQQNLLIVMSQDTRLVSLVNQD